VTDAPFRAEPATRHCPGRAPLARAAFVLTAGAIGLFVIGTALGFTLVGRAGGGAIQGWDNAVWRRAIQHRGPFVGLAKVVAIVGDAPVLGVICAVITVALIAALRSVRALALLTAYLGGEFEVFAIRQVIHRPRPITADFPARDAVRGVHETSYSYPSGHAVAVTAVLVAGLGMLGLAQRRIWPWVLALVGSLGVAATRVILGVHWLSDVTIGLLLGVAWGTTVAVVAQWLMPGPSEAHTGAGH
jgi:membrane-associated phospholipid phosphatase